jgi:ketosteroid isomerase-like protein
MSDSEANKVIVRRYFEMFNSGDMNQLADIVSDDYGDKPRVRVPGSRRARSPTAVHRRREAQSL